MAATCCAAGAVTVTATASVYRSSSMKNNNAAVVGAPSTSARVAVAPSRGLVRAAAVAEAIADKEVSLADSLRPTSADCARTLVEIANTGTISTTCEDGFALGTFASYVVDKKTGDLILRMRADALHTSNVQRDARCSLYVQPATQPPGVLSRATLIGSLELLDDAAAEAASKQYNAIHGENVGVDATGASDNYYKLVVDRVFYVGGLGSDKRAEVVSADDFTEAAADPLCNDANAIVDAMNNDRYEDVMNFARVSLPDQGEPAEARMLWVDTLGFDVRVITAEGSVLDVRMPFPTPAATLQEALSSLTMQAQLIWEEEKQYTPVPVPQEEPEEEKKKD